MANDPTCGLCGRPNSPHTGLNHQFSESGDLIASAPEEKPKMVVRVTADLVLRQALILKGLLTESDLIAGEVLLNEFLRDSADRPNS